MKSDISTVVGKFHPDVLARYDFSRAAYHGALKRMTGIVCEIHGEFSQYPSQLRKNGAGCPTCGGLVRASKRRASVEDVIQQANDLHAGFYTYERAVYQNNATKFIVTCPHHGDFTITPNNHLSGKGCPECGALKRGYRKDVGSAARKTADTKIAKFAEQFIADAKHVHGDVYDYTQVDYRGQQAKVTIVCPEHGEFRQTAEHHVRRAHGCPECSHHRSKGEASIAKFMGIFASVVERDRSAIAPKELDIYAEGASVAVEYCGEYWHAARKPEDEAFARKRHAEKHKACQALGIHLLTVYENEWRERPHAIKRLIRNALGKGRGRLMARKCDMRQVGPQDAAKFFEAHHPQGGSGWGIHYGLYHGTKLVACMRFTHGANDRGAGSERVWTLSRYATRVSVVGGASRLLAAFIEEHQPPVVKSFSDNRYFNGAMYEQLGFVMEEETAPDYQVYHPKTGLLPKASWQRSKIPQRIRDIGAVDSFDPATDPRSERGMTYALGAMRLFDCGKKRWIWHAPSL